MPRRLIFIIFNLSLVFSSSQVLFCVPTYRIVFLQKKTFKNNYILNYLIKILISIISLLKLHELHFVLDEILLKINVLSMSMYVFAFDRDN